jgi:phage baseplate assembly protein W
MPTIQRKVRTFKDLDLTFQKNPINKDVARKFDDDAIKQSIKTLLLTINYEVPFHPEIGSPIYGLLFEPATPITAEVIRVAISKTLDNFEPRADVQAINVIANPDQNSYTVTVVFKIANYFEPFTVNVILKRLR